MDDTTTQLLTLLNVSALKRKRPIIEPVESPKLNKRKKTAQLVDSNASPKTAVQHEQQVTPTQNEDNEDDEVHSNAPEDELQNEGD